MRKFDTVLQRCALLGLPLGFRCSVTSVSACMCCCRLLRPRAAFFPCILFLCTLPWLSPPVCVCALFSAAPMICAVGMMGVNYLFPDAAVAVVGAGSAGGADWRFFAAGAVFVSLHTMVWVSATASATSGSGAAWGTLRNDMGSEGRPVALPERTVALRRRFLWLIRALVLICGDSDSKHKRYVIPRGALAVPEPATMQRQRHTLPGLTRDQTAQDPDRTRYSLSIDVGMRF